MPEVFIDLSKYAVYIGMAGVVILVIGMLVRGGNQQGKSGASVASMFLITIGVIMILFYMAQLIGGAISGWSDFSSRMV